MPKAKHEPPQLREQAAQAARKILEGSRRGWRTRENRL